METWAEEGSGGYSLSGLSMYKDWVESFLRPDSTFLLLKTFDFWFGVIFSRNGRLWADCDPTAGGSLTASGIKGWCRFSGSLRAEEESEDKVVPLDTKEQEPVGLRPRIAMDRVENRKARSEGLGGQIGLHVFNKRSALLESRLHAPSPSLVQTLRIRAVSWRAVLLIQKTFWTQAGLGV